MENIIILGAGMAGYGAANKLSEAGVQTQVFEKNNHYGGHCASFIFDGEWVFDDGPHISFTKYDHVKELFASNINHDYYEFEAKVDNYWQGKWIKHPAQVNLYGLDPALNTQILQEMIELKNQPQPKINNYKDWLYASYGKTFAENFPMKYTRKFHTTEAENMDIDWIGPRLYQPDLMEVIYGMLSPETKDVHYVKSFRYPNHGGFVRYMSGIERITNLQLNHDLVGINLQKREMRFGNGKKVTYDYCFSSVPLPYLILVMDDAPPDIKEAAAKLVWTQCLVVNLGVARENISSCHWRYVYDEDFYVTRFNFPSMFGPNNTPKGCSSIQAEIYFSHKYRPLTKKPEDYIPIVKEELIRCGILTEEDTFPFTNAWVSPYAQIIFDHERKKSVQLLHEFLPEHDIYYGGRYADWNYAWSDQSFVRGEQGAEKIIDKL